MPLNKCQEGKESGWRWGTQGKCYTGPDGKKKAIKQGYAENPKEFKNEISKSGYNDLTKGILEEFSFEEQLVFFMPHTVEAGSADINNLPDSDFAYISPGGSKDSEGKTVPRSLRHLPIHDAAHVRNALARLNQTDIPAEAKKSAMTKIKAAAKKFGIDIGE